MPSLLTPTWGFSFAGRKDVISMSAPKKIGFIAFVVMLILFIIKLVRDEVTVEVDSDE